MTNFQYRDNNQLTGSLNMFHSQSIKNHYFFDAYNPALNKTHNQGQDTTSVRLDPTHISREPH